MKKILYYMAIYFSGSSFVVSAEEPAILLPEVVELIAPKKLDLSTLDNNRYIALLGATYADNDYYNVTKQAFARDYNTIYNALPIDEMLPSESIEELAVELNYIYATKTMLRWVDQDEFLRNNLFCALYGDTKCIDKIIAARDRINELLVENEKIIERYHTIFNDYTIARNLLFPREASLSTPMPSYQNIINIFRVKLAYSTLLIADHKIEEGIADLTLLQEYVNLMAKPGQEIGLLDIMMVSAMQQGIDQYIDALLNSKYAPALLDNPNFDALMEKHIIYGGYIQQTTLQALLAETETSVYLLLEPILASKEVSVAEVNQYYTRMNAFDEIYQKAPYDKQTAVLAKALCEDVTNYVMKSSCESSPLHAGYAERNETQRNYHNMVHVKYLIMKNNIKDQQVPEFLSSKGNMVVDPMTKMEFNWNPELRTLSLPLPENRYLPMSIRRSLERDLPVENLQVVIPN